MVLDDAGLRRSDIVNWYLKTIEKDIETEEELAEKKIILEKVLDRLITHVSWNIIDWYKHHIDQENYIIKKQHKKVKASLFSL